MTLFNILSSFVVNPYHINIKVRAAKLKMKKIKPPIVVKRNLTMH